MSWSVSDYQSRLDQIESKIEALSHDIKDVTSKIEALTSKIDFLDETMGHFRTAENWEAARTQPELHETYRKFSHKGWEDLKDDKEDLKDDKKDLKKKIGLYMGLIKQCMEEKDLYLKEKKQWMEKEKKAEESVDNEGTENRDLHQPMQSQNERLDDHTLSSVGGLVPADSAVAAARSVRSFKSQSSDAELHIFMSITPSAKERQESKKAVEKSKKYRRKQESQMEVLGLEPEMRSFIRNQFNTNPKEGYFAVKEQKSMLTEVGTQAQELLNFKQSLGTYELRGPVPSSKTTTNNT